MELTFTCVPLSIQEICGELCNLSGIFGTTNTETMTKVFFQVGDQVIKAEGSIIKLERKVDNNGAYFEATIVMRYTGGTTNAFDYEKLMIGDVEITQEGR